MQAIILTTLSLIFLAEAWLEQAVIDLKNPYIHQYSTLNQREHFRSAVLAVMITVPFYEVAVWQGLYGLCPAIFVNRRLFFDLPLKILRGRTWYRYEGDGAVDTFCRRLFGVNGAWKEMLLHMLVTLLSIYCS